MRHNNVEAKGVMMVSQDDLKELDYASNVLLMGVRLPRKDDEGPILSLSLMDWTILYRLLTSKIPLEEGGSIRAVDESNSLQLLARYARGAVEWYTRTGVVPRPDSPVDAWEEK